MIEGLKGRGESELWGIIDASVAWLEAKGISDLAGKVDHTAFARVQEFPAAGTFLSLGLQEDFFPFCGS